jgi:(1->4)-alpha-D-glucan 1-alpha-D-glucosylmutase
MALQPVPNAALGYLLWQTAVALRGSADPLERQRFHAYAQKAMREAADGTGWVDQDQAFETAVQCAVDAAYDNPKVCRLVASLAARIEPHARVNSLSQKVIQLTMPGVPDVYQGSELLEDSLADPDNRRPVDFNVRRASLNALNETNTPPAVDGTGLAKLWVVSRALRARREHPELFAGYAPLLADGPGRDHLVAFDRGGALTLATRLPAGLRAAGGWGDTILRLPPGRYRDVFTGSLFDGESFDGKRDGGLRVVEVLDRYPVALLLAEET